jgi:hypothetical protein
VAEILLGTSVSGRPGAAAREGPAQASLALLSASGSAVCVSLCFHDETPPDSPLEALRALRRDARTVSGVDGPRKPLVSEMLDVLAVEAERRGLRRVALVNGDIAVTAEAIALAASAPHPALAIPRTDVGGDAPAALLRHGIDMVTFDAAFWRRERRRFRDYLLGEPVWDNVYAAIVACHGGAIVNREGLLLHPRHPAAFGGSPYARYVHLLAARDSSYFSLWCDYVARVEALAPDRLTEDGDAELQRQVFRAPGVAADALDVARATWWRARQVFGA